MMLLAQECGSSRDTARSCERGLHGTTVQHTEHAVNTQLPTTFWG